MIPLMLWWILQKIYRHRKKTGSSSETVKFRSTTSEKMLAFAAFAVTLSSNLWGQEKILKYAIVRHAEKIGTMVLHQKIVGNTLTISLESEVTLNVLIRIRVQEQESATFRGGVLVHSSIKRLVNGVQKINRHLELLDSNYRIIGGSTEWSPSYPLYYHVLWLYYQEPKWAERLYSDNYQQFVSVHVFQPGIYALKLPNGSTNYYTYTNGVCHRVEINQPFFQMQFVLQDETVGTK